ncbi:hypothetical protein ANN_17490 [Periplaneta americana]|uniref:Uncharacterized protein n=1 Tax=Periplaneta americana TaxID=6978 RepID=A0ABQ8ST37_PERAM|nr:hypothetical protein ANN_17490 [Periplaneta americana]
MVACKYEQSWEKLVSSTDGAPSMIGHSRGLFLNEIGISRNSVKMVHCIINREALGSKSANSANVMSVVVKALNLIKANSLRHRQFQEYLHDICCDYDDLTYYSQVRWLSRGHMLHRFYNICAEVDSFLKGHNITIPEISDSEWSSDLAFLMDLCDHLTRLNRALQGKNRSIVDMADASRSFMGKLKLCQTKEAPLNCQLEIIDMQNNTRIRSSGKLGIELWRLIDKYLYPNLKNLASRMLAMFEETHVCEQFFSVMNNNKNNRRSRISDSNLVATLRVSVSKLQPDIDRLAAAKTPISPPEKTE